MFRFVKFIIFILFLQFSNVVFSQQKEAADSLVRLVEARSANLETINDISFRKVIGPARFLHNNTYLLCDTAIWNVNTNIIDAVGNVQIIQENTFLKSDKIEYVVEENTAKFRGNLVELFDKEGNILRTNYLDYNTKDSIAVFYAGAALKNNDGNLIESDSGKYESALKVFTFSNNVNMFTDSVFIKSDEVKYKTDINKAFFGKNTTAWKDDNILFTNSGEFDRPEQIFLFDKDGYILTKEQEIWADTLKYFSNSGEAELHNNVQLLDTVKSTFCLADDVRYFSKPMRIELRKKPVLGSYSYENGVADTLFFIADTIYYYNKRYCDIDSSTISLSKERLKLSKVDPFEEIDRKSREAMAAIKRNYKANKDSLARAMGNIKIAKKVDEKKDKGEGNNIGIDSLKNLDSLGSRIDSLGRRIGSLGNQIDSLGNGIDSLNSWGGIDTLSMKKDSLGFFVDTLGNRYNSIGYKVDSLGNVIDSIGKKKVGLDTTEIAFIDAFKNIKFFRQDIQGKCDTLLYNGLDSIARFYSNPVMWSDTTTQFSADSIQAVISNGKLNKINLITNAFISSKEDTLHYNQVKSAEMAAFFKDNELYRFDAFGGASALLFLEEDSVITLMNQKNSKLLTASVKDNVLQRVRYVEDIKEDVYPVYNLTLDKMRLRGFNWRGDEAPKSRFDLTDRSVRPSKREEVNKILFPNYIHTGLYFPQMRESIFEYKRYSDSLLVAKELEKERKKLAEQAAKDSLENKRIADSLALKDSLSIKDSLNIKDSLSVADSLKQNSNTISKDSLDNKLSKRELRIKRREEKKKLKAEKRAKRREVRAEKRAKRRELRAIRREERKARRNKS